MRIILLFLVLLPSLQAGTIPDLREEKISLNKDVSMDMINVRNGLWVAKYELTQREWFAVMGKGEMYRTAPWLQDPTIRDDNKPMDNCSLALATNFCTKMSVRTHSKIRLPTEEEWDFFSNGTELESAVCSIGMKDHRLQPSQVGTGKPNRFGLFDVRGNVMEICSSSWTDYKLKAGKTQTYKPTLGNPGNGPWVALRGGCYWFASKQMMAIDFRDFALPIETRSQPGAGIRVVMEK